VETGGKMDTKNPITEIAIVIISGATLEEIARFSTFVKPYGGLVIEQEALDYTGITMKQIEGGMEVEEVVEAVIKITKETKQSTSHHYKPIVVGHNVQFDIGFIRGMFEHVKADYDKSFNKDYFCTMRLDHARNYATPELGYKLEECCDRAGVELIDAHGAINDTLATTDLFKYHILAMRSGKGELNKSKEKKTRDTFQFNLP